MNTLASVNSDSPRGYIYALTAYGMWGLLPLYMKALEMFPPAQIIAHRALWSLPIAAAVLIWQRRGADVLDALKTPRLLAMAAVTATLITCNWMIYVWAVSNGYALDAALGYYINPLFSVLLGAVLLGEKLSRTKLVAVALAFAAVVVLTIQAGNLPLAAVGLTISWAFYAYFKKSLPLGPNQGFTLEVLLLSPLAIAYLIWLHVSGQGVFGGGSSTEVLLLLGCSIVAAWLRTGHGHSLTVLREWGKIVATINDWNHAIHCADNDIPDRRSGV